MEGRMTLETDGITADRRPVETDGITADRLPVETDGITADRRPAGSCDGRASQLTDRQPGPVMDGGQVDTGGSPRGRDS